MGLVRMAFPGLASAVLVAACSVAPAASPKSAASAPAVSGAPAVSDAPAVSAAAPTGRDAWLVVHRAGQPELEAILASTGERLLDLPEGVPDATWGHLLTTSLSGGETVVRQLGVADGSDRRVTLGGAWRLPTIGREPLPVGVSEDASTIVLVENRADDAKRATSRFAVLDASLAGDSAVLELPGSFDYDAISPDGRTLYVVEHLPAPPEGHYQVRAVDVKTGKFRDGVIVDKRNLDEVMGGYPIAQLRRPGGLVFTLYQGAQHPFVHALETVEGWAVCIDLPTGSGDAGAASDWGLAAAPDGKSVYAVNATLGAVAEIDPNPEQLVVRRSATVVTAAAEPVVQLAKFGHQEAAPAARRVVVAPGGETIYAAGTSGIVIVSTAALEATGRFLEGRRVDGLALTPDGRSLFALAGDDGSIIQLDLATGSEVRVVPGRPFDRLLAVVPY